MYTYITYIRIYINTTYNYVTGLAKTLHFCTNIKNDFIAQNTLKNYPCIVSLLSNVNRSAFLEGTFPTL